MEVVFISLSIGYDRKVFKFGIKKWLFEFSFEMEEELLKEKNVIRLMKKINCIIELFGNILRFDNNNKRRIKLNVIILVRVNLKVEKILKVYFL